jgi:hypothetical protein
LAKHRLFFIDGIRFIHANQNHFFELFQIVANSETSSMEIVFTFAEAVVFTESSETVSYKGSQKEHDMNGPFEK